MRAILLAIALAGCATDIQGGSYYCGAQAACPEGLACDGETNLCVPPIDVTAFTCAEGAPLTVATCGNSSRESTGCVNTADGHDLISYTTADGCTVAVTVTIAYPVAFLPLTATVTSGGTVVATSAPCGDVHGGNASSCATFTGQPGTTYTIDVAATPGAGTCNGACGFNRFALTVQTTAP